MIYRVAIRHLIRILISAFLLYGLEARAELVSKNLYESVVAVNVFRSQGKSTVTGVVVQADPYNGYVVTNSALIKNSDTLTITVSKTGAELVAQIVKTDATTDLALLKVNGLNLRPLIFGLENAFQVMLSGLLFVGILRRKRWVFRRAICTITKACWIVGQAISSTTTLWLAVAMLARYYSTIVGS